MVKMLPDRTFYPSAALAADRRRGLAYVALLAAESNGTTPGQTDAIGVVDVNPASPEYGQLVGKVDFPQGGNELHHFGWNACSSPVRLRAQPAHRTSLPRGARHGQFAHSHRGHEAGSP